MVTFESAGKTTDLNTVREQMGVKTNASTSKSKTGPPAESEYPVDPVCVPRINPSAWHFRTGFSSLKICVYNIFDGSPADTTTSLSASGTPPSSVDTASLQHFSTRKSSFRHLSTAAYASLGSTSVRKPRT